MIITKTPYRISFFGGGTDYHTWYQEHGGAVLSTTINHYCNLTCSLKPPFFDKKHRIVWKEIEEVNENDEIKHPVVREVLNYLDIKRGVEIHYQGDLPARSGLGSSSSFAVGLLNAIYALRGQMSSKQSLACEAVHIERDILKENVGVQDQIAASYGGLNKITINPDCTFSVNPILMSAERKKDFNDHLLLFFTGISRTASNIAGNKIKNIPNKQQQLSTMMSMVEESIKILTESENLDDFGKLLHETWLLKRQLSDSISTSFIDEVYEKARKAGAIGGKLLGAGGGGFILFFVKPEKQPEVLNALSDLLLVPFNFENKGSNVVSYTPNIFSRTSLLRRDFAHLKESRNIDNLKTLCVDSEFSNYNKERFSKFKYIK